MANKSTIVEVTVPFRVTINKYGEISSVEPMKLMQTYFDEAAQQALDEDNWGNDE